MSGRFPLHEETSVVLSAPLDAVFAHLDDFHKLGAHMEKPSGMMMGSKMAIQTDERHGRAVGSKVRMSGKMLGMTLSLEEVVTEREAPWRKAWETVNTDLLVVGPYRLGFELSPEEGRTRVKVFIDYALPDKRTWLGRLLGKTYARWCTRRMAGDALAHFSAA